MIDDTEATQVRGSGQDTSPSETDRSQTDSQSSLKNGKANSDKITPEMQAKVAEIQLRLRQTVGQVVLAMMSLPRYRHQSLADLQHLVIDPLIQDRISIANVRPPEGEDEPSGQETTVGMAIWASVSDDVSAKIAEQVQAGTFPLRLARDDWTSGDTLWLIDVIAPDRQSATSVLSSFRQIAGDKPVRIHPIVAQSVDRELLEKLRAPKDRDGKEQKATMQ